MIATVRCHGKTGVEMEALCAVSVGLLTLYDMVKAVEPSATITQIELLETRRQDRPHPHLELTQIDQKSAPARCPRCAVCSAARRSRRRYNRCLSSGYRGSSTTGSRRPLDRLPRPAAGRRPAPDRETFTITGPRWSMIVGLHAKPGAQSAALQHKG